MLQSSNLIKGIVNKEIATHPAGARNDKKEVFETDSQGRENNSTSEINEFVLATLYLFSYFWVH
jgi:hypothetical protein